MASERSRSRQKSMKAGVGQQERHNRKCMYRCQVFLRRTLSALYRVPYVGVGKQQLRAHKSKSLQLGWQSSMPTHRDHAPQQHQFIERYSLDAEPISAKPKWHGALSTLANKIGISTNSLQTQNTFHRLKRCMWSSGLTSHTPT
jgi:hypothetical protein